MKCRKCHVTISDVDKYCPRCGELFDNGDVERLGNNLENRLFNIYYNKIGTSFNFSLGYLLFNFFYVIYKKMYYEAIYCIIADFILINLIFNWQRLLLGSMGFNFLFIIFSFLIAITINLYYILKFDDLYITRIKNFIAKSIKRYGTKDISLLTKICKKDSKGNWLGVILSIIIIGILTYVTIIY